MPRPAYRPVEPQRTDSFAPPSYRARTLSPTEQQLKQHELTNRFVNARIDGSFPDMNLAVIGAGNLYHGAHNVEGQLNRILADNGDHRYIVDPNSANPFRTLDTLPNNVMAMVATPSGLHVPQVAKLLSNSNVNGIMVEKPMATTPQQLAMLDFLVKNSSKPMYFANDLYFRALPLLAAMGKPMPYKDKLDVAPGLPGTDALKRAIQTGQPVLGKIVDIQGQWVYNWNKDAPPQKSREWLWKKETGGGELLDLFVHVANVLSFMGYRPDPARPYQYTVLGWDFNKQDYMPLKRAQPPYDADWFSHIQETLTGPDQNPVKFQFNVGLNPVFANEDYLQLTDERGMKLRMPMKYTHENDEVYVDLLDPNNQTVGRIYLSQKPYYLMMHHALSYLNTGKPAPLFYEEQKAALDWIFRIKENSAA